MALVSVLSKIVDKVFFHKLPAFLDKWNIREIEQHGFRKEKSTESAVLYFTNTVLGALDGRGRLLPSSATHPMI